MKIELIVVNFSAKYLIMINEQSKLNFMPQKGKFLHCL